MASIGFSELLARFEVFPRKDLKFLTPIIQIEGLFSDESQQPENLSENLYDPNDFYIEPKPEGKKKNPTESKQKQILLIGKPEEQKESQVSEEKKKNYKPGPFALFYELNEGTLNKDAEVWYYKEGKDIVGPVSSYNMDKMVYYHKIEDETRVAFQSVEKFVKFAKINKIVEAEKKNEW